MNRFATSAVWLLIFCLQQNTLAQHSDCITALPVCDNASLNFSSAGAGIDDFANFNNDNGCLLFGEHQSVWLVIKISQLSSSNAQLGLTITPNGNQANDFDFAVYGPQSNCDNLGSPIACSYANNNPATCTFCPLTGMGMGETDAIEGATGNGFVSNIEVQPLEVYYILIDNFEANQTGFSLTWTGDAILDCDLYCLANAGTYEISELPGNQTTNFPTPDSIPQYILCDGDGLFFATDENYSLPLPFAGEESSLLWALYTEESPAFPSPDDAGFTGILLDEDFITEINTNGIQSISPNGLNLNNNTLWVIPVTGDDGSGNGNPNGNVAIDEDGDVCYNYGEPFAITYLNEIEYEVVNACTEFEIAITGGMPELYGGGYVISNVQPANAVLNNYFPQLGETITFSEIALASSWSFTITDGNGCSIQASGIFNFTGDTPAINAEEIQTFCDGDSIILMANTDYVGTNYEWQWIDEFGVIYEAQNLYLQDPLLGEYLVSLVIDGCAAENVQVQLEVFPNPVLDPFADEISCEMEFDFNTLTITGENLDNAAINFYSDLNGAPGLTVPQVISNGGTFWVEAVTNGICVAQQPFEIALNDLNISLNGVQNISCFGAADGAINTNVFGGSQPLTFEWIGSDSEMPDISNLEAGSYSLLVTDSLGCQDSLTATVIQPDSLEAILVELTDPSCYGANDGMANMEVLGGTSPYAFNWSNGEINSTTTNLNPNENYSLTVTDANNCVVILDSFLFLTEPVEIQLNAIVSDTQCGASEGSIILNVTGGSGNLNYEWSHDANLNNDSANNLPTGNYSVTIADNSDCILEESFAVSDLGSPDISIVNILSENCFQNDGAIEISIAGGVGNLNVQWSHDADFQGLLAEQLEAGDYFITVSNPSGCQAILAASVPSEEPAELSISNIQMASCEAAVDGAATIEVLGGSPPFTYLWSHDNDLNSATANNLPYGNISVGVLDANNCLSTLSFTLGAINNQELIIENTEPAYCNQNTGSIELNFLNATQPISYLWSHDGDFNDSFAQNIPGGTYEIYATDANGCSHQISVTLPNLDAPSIDFERTLTTGCLAEDGALEAIITGGVEPYTFEWSHDSTLNSALADSLSSGVYWLTVTDANGCTNELKKAMFYLNPNPPILDTVLVIHTLCGLCTGEIWMTTTGGVPPYTYNWEPDVSQDSFALNLCPGDYFIQVTDADGCTDRDSITVLDSGPIPIEINFINLQHEHCGQSDGSLTAVLPNGINFEWTSHPQFNGQNVLTNIPAGTYEAIPFGACPLPFDTLIQNIPPPEIELEDIQHITCEQNSMVNLSASGGDGALSFIWSHDQNYESSSAENLPEGDYTVTVTDDYGCLDSLSFSINEGPMPVAQISNLTHTNCGEGTGSASIVAFGGNGTLSYHWSHNPFLTGSEANLLEEGMYSVSIQDEASCELVLDFEILGSNTPELSVLEQVNTSCGGENGNILVDITGGNAPYYFNWSHEPNLTSPSATNLSSGIYEVTVTDFNGCSDSLSISISDSDAPEISIDGVQADFCGDASGSILITASGGTGDFIFMWQHDPNLNLGFAQNLEAGIYAVTVIDDLGCQNVAAVEVEGLPLPEIELLAFQNDLCHLGNGYLLVQVLNGLAPYEYHWSHDSTINSPYVQNLSEDIYTLNITDVNGCTAQTNLNITGSEPPVLEIQNLQPHLCNNQTGSIEISATAGTPPFNYTWSHDTLLSNNVAFDLEGGLDFTYTVHISDQFNCRDSLDFNIPKFDSPNLHIDSLLGTHCQLADGAAYLNSTPYAVYRINCGYTGNNIYYDRYGNGYHPDAYFEGGNTIVNSFVSNTVTNDLFSRRRYHTNSFSYHFPLENGDYTVRLGFSTDHFVDNPDNNRILDVMAENETKLDSFSIFDNFGVTVAGHQTFEVTVNDFSLDLDFIPVQWRAIVATIEIIPNNQPTFEWSWQQIPNLLENQEDSLPAGTYTVSLTDENGCVNSLDFDIEMLDITPEFDPEVIIDTCGTHAGSIVLNPIQPAAIRINCGGSAYTTNDGRYFAANLGSNNQIETTNEDFTNTLDDVLYQSRRKSNPDYYFDLPNGKYLVRLHFGEMADIPADNKVFNIDLEKRKVLPNFHIANYAGGNFLAVIKEFEVYVNDGELNIDTKLATKNGELSALEVLPLPEYPMDYDYVWAFDENLTENIADSLLFGDYEVSIIDAYGCEKTLEFTVPTTPLPLLNIIEIQDARCNLPSGLVTVEALGELSQNGDFEEGNVGFYSDYQYVTSGAGHDKYQIENNPNDMLGSFANCGDHTTGDGLMMVVDGSNQANKKIYCETLTIPLGGTLEFSVWATSVHPNITADLQFYINEEPVSDILDLSSNLCEWQELAGTWIADTTIVEICLINQHVGGSSNDFALDDFSFKANYYDVVWTHDSTIVENTAEGLTPGTYEITATTEWGCEAAITAEVGNIEPRGMEVASLKIPGCDLFNGRAKITSENVYRINVGGASYISPATGYLFEGDSYGIGGGSNFNNNEVENTDDSELYQSHRLGNFEYQFPVPDSGEYEIILHFAEPNQQNRIFDVFVNNELVVNDLSIYGEANFNEAFTKSIIATAPDSILVISFLGNGSNAILSAIEIFHAIPANTTFSWSHDSNLNASRAENLGEGSYQVLITEPDGCEHEVNFDLGRPDNPALWLLGSVEPAACLGILGSAEVQAIGVGGYSYGWSHNGTLNASSANDLIAGDYFVIVTDKKNCKDTLDITLLDLTIPQIHLDSLANTICQQDDGFIYVTASGGAGSYQYAWAHNDTLIVPHATDLISGTYTVFVTDKNGCVAQEDIDIEDLGPDLELSELVDTECGLSFGQIVVEEVGTPIGNWTISWSHDPNLDELVASNLPSGNYTIIAEDESNCTDTLATFIGDTDGPDIVDLMVGQPDSCNVATGFAALLINGGEGNLTYTWSHDEMLNDSTIQNLPMGNYSVTVTDENDCENQADFEIVEPISPTLTLGTLEIETCEDSNGEANIFVTGGNAPLNFDWSHDNILDTNFVNGLSEGNYSVTVTDSKLCSEKIDFNINGIHTPLIVEDSLETTFCQLENGSIFLEIQSNADSIFYNWSHDANLNEPFATNLPDGNYAVTISDNYDCETEAEFEIEVVLDSLETAQYESICDGESIDYLGLSYQSDTSFCVPFNTALAGCDSIHCFTLEILPKHDIQIPETTCVPNQAGIFTQLLVNEFGCDSIITRTVMLLPRDTTYLENTTCEPIESGIFHQDLTNQWGCDSLVINTVDLLPSDSFYFPEYNCRPETWGLFPELYNNEFGCDSLIVREYLPANYDLEAIIEQNQSVDLGQVIEIEVLANFLPDSILWSPPFGLDCIDCLEPTIFITEDMSYTVFLQDENGCSIVRELNLEVQSTYDVYIPNAFSPNGDGINDIFHIYSSPNVQIVHEFKIFDRWGDWVFEAYDFYPNDPNYGWDGVFRGTDMNPAVFAYFAIVEFLDGEVRMFKGDVTLVR